MGLCHLKQFISQWHTSFLVLASCKWEQERGASILAELPLNGLDKKQPSKLYCQPVPRQPEAEPWQVHRGEVREPWNSAMQAQLKESERKSTLQGTHHLKAQSLGSGKWFSDPSSSPDLVLAAPFCVLMISLWAHEMRVLQGFGAEQMRFLQPVVVYVIYVRVKENPRRPMSWSTTTEREKTSG